MNNSKRILRAAALLLLAVLVGCKGSGERRASAPLDTYTAAAMVSAWDFREYALNSYARALQVYGRGGVLAGFAKLDQEVWPAGDPTLGWSYFFNSSVISVVTLADGHKAVAFYHPWSDVFLLGLWQWDGVSGYIIADVEVLPGSVVRRQTSGKVGPYRLWLAREMYAPYGAGLATVESVKAFEAAATGAADFRTFIRSLADDKTVEGSHYVAGIQLVDTLTELSGFVSGQSGLGPGARRRMADMTDSVIRNDMGRALQEAAYTPAESRDALSKLKIEEWKTFKPAAFLDNGQTCVMVLVAGKNPETYLSAMMVKAGGGVQLRRLDLLSFGRLYDNADSFMGAGQ